MTEHHIHGPPSCVAGATAGEKVLPCAAAADGVGRYCLDFLRLRLVAHRRWRPEVGLTNNCMFQISKMVVPGPTSDFMLQVAQYPKSCPRFWGAIGTDFPVSIWILTLEFLSAAASSSICR